MRKELKQLDSNPSKVRLLDETMGRNNHFTEGASWRDKSEYRKKHKRMIKKSLRSALKTQLEKEIPSLDEVKEGDLLNKYTNLYSEMNEKQRN